MHTHLLIATTLAAACAGRTLAADFSFSPPVVSALPQGHTPTAVRLADLDGDGKVDAVVTGRNWNGDAGGTGRVSVLRGMGNGVFSPWNEVLVTEGHTEDAAIADVTQDGTLDLVMTVASRRGRLAVARGHADGTFDAPIYVDLERQPRGVAVGDLDGDGDPDVSAINYGSASLQTLTNNYPTGGTFALHETKRLGRYIGAIPSPVATSITDLDGDGTLDATATLLGGGRVSIARGAATGLAGPVDWKPANVAGEAPAVIGASIADLDGDGDADIALPVLMVTQSQKLIVLRNGGDATFAQQSVFDTVSFFYAWCSAPIDVDGDSRIDMAVGTALSGSVSFLRNQTASPTSTIELVLQPVIIPYGVFVRDLTSADVDNDGDQDLVGVDIGGSTVFVALNQTPQGGVADGVVSRPPSPKRGAPQPMFVRTDMTGDGAIDAADVAFMLEQGVPSTQEAKR